MIPLKKKCNRCEEEKELDEFHKNSYGKFGRYSTCKACRAPINKEKWKTYSSKEGIRERIRKQSKERYKENHEQEIERSRVYRRDNKDKIKQSQKNYYLSKKGIDNRKKKDLKRKARRLGVQTESFTIDELFTFWIGVGIDPDCCYYCSIVLTSKNRTVDHYIPLAKMGPHIKENLKPACRSCNSSKQDSDPVEWAKQRYTWW